MLHEGCDEVLWDPVYELVEGVAQVVNAVRVRGLRLDQNVRKPDQIRVGGFEAWKQFRDPIAIEFVGLTSK